MLQQPVGNCVAVFRREFASLREITDDLLARTDGYLIPQGSIIILSSATQLATGGVPEYIQDLAAISRWFLNNCDVVVIPGPPMLLDGTSSAQLIRGVVEVSCWLAKADEVADTLLPAFMTAIEAMREGGTGSQPAILQ